jgi:tetratricopeptide (TPR) repeat protein
MKSVGILLRSLWASVHSAWGMLAYRLGCRAAARSHFERVLLLRGDDFRAYIELGRIAFDLGDYATWRREFEHARRMDPARFARLRHPLELFEPRLAGTRFDDAATPFDASPARTPWRPLRTSGQRSDGEASEASTPRFVRGLPDPTPNKAASQDDCGDATERERLRALGPIGVDELRRCDLDDLARRLSG